MGGKKERRKRVREKPERERESARASNCTRLTPTPACNSHPCIQSTFQPRDRKISLIFDCNCGEIGLPFGACHIYTHQHQSIARYKLDLHNMDY